MQRRRTRIIGKYPSAAAGTAKPSDDIRNNDEETTYVSKQNNSRGSVRIAMGYPIQKRIGPSIACRRARCISYVRGSSVRVKQYGKNALDTLARITPCKSKLLPGEDHCVLSARVDASYVDGSYCGVLLLGNR